MWNLKFESRKLQGARFDVFLTSKASISKYVGYFLQFNTIVLQIKVLYMSSSFWLLRVESHDFSHAEKERTACKVEKIHKIFTQKGS